MGSSNPVNPISYLETVDTPTLSNAIEELAVRPRHEGFAPLAIQCLFPQFGRMCGYAVTAQVETITRGAKPDRALYCDLFDAVAGSPKPAIVVLQEVGPLADFAAHCGEVMATAFTRMGAIGVVSDSGVRDIEEVRAMGMHYFARGKVASHAWFHIVRVNVPVHVCGLPVSPGDILHGDENGLISVPPCDWDALGRAVEDVRDRERKLMDFMRSDRCTTEALRRRFLE